MAGILYTIDGDGTQKQLKLEEGTTGSYVDVTGLDPIVLQAVLEFIQRSRVGFAKYGTTLSDNDTDDFIQHAKEEAMDFVNYLCKLESQAKK